MGVGEMEAVMVAYFLKTFPQEEKKKQALTKAAVRSRERYL